VLVDCGTSQEVLSVEDTGEDILILKPLFIIGTDPVRYTESKSAAITSVAARELAAILTHFADTGELPGEVGDEG
jgi:hypothetical protein